MRSSCSVPDQQCSVRDVHGSLAPPPALRCRMCCRCCVRCARCTGSLPSRPCSLAWRRRSRTPPVCCPSCLLPRLRLSLWMCSGWQPSRLRCCCSSAPPRRHAPRRWQGSRVSARRAGWAESMPFGGSCLQCTAMHPTRQLPFFASCLVLDVSTHLPALFHASCPQARPAWRC